MRKAECGRRNAQREFANGQPNNSAPSAVSERASFPLLFVLLPSAFCLLRALCPAQKIHGASVTARRRRTHQGENGDPPSPARHRTAAVSSGGRRTGEFPGRKAYPRTGGK